jgi:hypothetical protein
MIRKEGKEIVCYSLFLCEVFIKSIGARGSVVG